MSFRKLLAHLIRDEHETHVGRLGELTFYAGEIYQHDGVTPGGNIISAGGGGGGGPVTWASIINKPNFATVSTSGSYTDLVNKPNIPTKVSDLTNDSGFITGVSWAQVTGKPAFATVATSGSYTDLINKPTLFSGSYNDLTNKPAIPDDISDLADATGLLVGIGDFIFSGGTASLPAGGTMVLDTLQDGGNKQSTLTLSTSGISSLDVGNNLRLRVGNGTGFEKDWVFGADGSLRFPDNSVQSTAYTGNYNDLTNKPAIPDDISDLTDTTNLLFSGDYNDLINKPAIPDSLLDLNIVDGTNGQVLTTNGAGGFSFTTVATGSLNARDVTRVYAYATNADSVTIQKGQPVYMFAATGNRVSVKLASNLGDATSAKTLGLADEAIAPGNPGYICTQGVVSNINTNGYSEGDALYLGATPGTLTNVKPHAPNHLVYIGVVERANNGNGLIYVRPQNGYELNEIHDVNLIDNPPENGDVLTYNSVTGLWGAAPVPGAGLLAAGPQGPAGAAGAQGPAGADGADGQDGTSAYEVAVANGFVGNESAWLASLVGAQGPAGTQGPQGERAEEDRLVNGAQEVVLNSDGTLTTPAGLSISKQLDGSAVHIGSTIQSDFNKNLRLQTLGTGSGSLAWQNNEGDANFVTLNYNQSKNIMISVGNAVGEGVLHNWLFASTGNIQLPPGGDIVDIAGNSVLGGGSGATTLSALTDVALEGPVEGSVLTWNDTQGHWENRSLPAASEITNTHPEGPTYSVSVGTDGVVTMVTSRGNLEFGALPEEGAPQHLHIMRPAGQEGSSDLYFGDDYNYVKLPGSYGVNTLGVEIGSNDGQGGSTSVWRFGTDGDLVLPAGKTIRDISGTDLLAGDGTGGDPAYKGFKAHYGRMWGNNDDPNGPINKIVIYKDTVTPNSTIDTSANNDTFSVTGLTGSDVVAMLVVIGDEINQTTTAELKTFAESVIDNVILDEGVEGDINNINAMKTAFYNNFNTFSATITDRKANFEFFNINNQFTINPTFTTGDGASFSGISYNMNNDTLDLGSWGQGAPNTHEVGDVHVIPGNTIQDANGNFLLTPDNDVTVTITGVADGWIQTFTVTGTLPRPAVIWPSDYISDGGDDEYDSGNYINTNLDTNISYNDGNVVTSSSAFGNGDYVVTYNDGIFGVFAVNADISSISTSGGSGFDGNGQADTGSLYGAADSGVNIGDFVFNGSTLTATDDDLYIKAVDDLWLDALEDDIHIRANDDVRIKVGYNFDADSAQREWRFDTSGYIQFPDGSQQSTAYTGNNNSFSGNYNDLTNKPTGNTAVHDLIGGASSLDDGKYLKQTSIGISEWADLPASFDGDYNSLTNKPTIRIAVPTGSGPGGNLQADSLALAGLNPTENIPSTYGGDLILQGGVGGANSDLYGEVRIKSGTIGANYEWHFTTDKKIKLPAGGDIVDSTGVSVLGGGGTTLPLDAAGVLKNDGTGTLSWSSLDIQDLTDNGNLLNFTQAQANWEENNAASPAYIQNKPTIITSYYQLADLPTLFNGDYLSLTGTPSLANVATTGMYGDLTGTPTSLADFTNDPGFITAGDLAVSNSGSGSLTYSNGLFTYEGPTVPTDISQLTDNTNLLSGGGTTLPADASGYLNNNGSGTLSWVPGNPSGSGMLPYNGVTVVSNTTTADWTEFTLSGTMDSLWDYNNTVAAVTLSSATAYGKTITPNTKNMWVVDAKVNSNNNLVVEFPTNPTVGDVFTVTPIVITVTVNAGSFVVGQTYTIISAGNTNWTSIGAQHGGSVGQSFVATGAGHGTGVATTALGASRLIFKPAAGQRARTMSVGQTGPVVFGQGGTYNFMFLDLAGQNVNSPMTWVFAGAIDGIPTWYHTYF